MCGNFDESQGEDILSILSIVCGLPEDPKGWVLESAIVRTLRLLNLPPGKQPLQAIKVYLHKLTAKSGWLREREGKDEPEYACGMGAIARIGSPRLVRLRKEFRERMDETRTSMAEAIRSKLVLPPELEGMIDFGDDMGPITPSDFGTMVGTMAIQLVRDGKLRPLPTAPAMEKLAAAVRELQNAGTADPA